MNDLPKTPAVASITGLLWVIRLFALVAAAVATYLFVLSMSGRGLPVGCGSGSGCAEVLQSTWSAVFNIPVSGPALLAYAAVIFATFLVKTNASAFTQEMGWRLLVGLGTAIAASIMWFVVVQL
ncbi:MAG: putative membrane protein, partial [Pirellulaceae bacterium]